MTNETGQKYLQAEDAKSYGIDSRYIFNGFYWPPEKVKKELLKIKKQTEYKVIKANTEEELSEKVTDFLQNGWNVAGGLLKAGEHFLQAITFQPSREHIPNKRWIGNGFDLFWEEVTV